MSEVRELPITPERPAGKGRRQCTSCGAPTHKTRLYRVPRAIGWYCRSCVLAIDAYRASR